jgi:C-terminal peptidase prc
LRVFQDLWNKVNERYVYADFNGLNWKAIGARYETTIRQGTSDSVFFALMNAMIGELGDEHSHFQSPQEIRAEQDEIANRYNFVGIGSLNVTASDGKRAVIIEVFPNSPAADAGLRPHDAIVQVDGGPIFDSAHVFRTLGPAGSQVTLTIQRPGESLRNITLTRRAVTGALPLNYCLVPNTSIGYIFIPNLLDATLGDQIRQALQKMTADGKLDGLILDNRMNGGGQEQVARSLLSLFANGVQGAFVSRDIRRELRLAGEDVSGSQSVPLVVLVDRNTVSYGEILSGVLRTAGRAKIVGQTTYGNVELLQSIDFEDGSRAWIASETFEPPGQRPGIWEKTGIVPDVRVPTEWDLFTEANDPALAKAVELLMNK